MSSPACLSFDVKMLIMHAQGEGAGEKQEEEGEGEGAVRRKTKNIRGESG